jgi:hypothetical protein
MGQDLSTIYENSRDKYDPSESDSNLSVVYQNDHRKSSGTLSATWSSASADGTYAPGTLGHTYDDTDLRNESVASKNVFGMVKTEDGQFPFLSNVPESVFRSNHAD